MTAPVFVPLLALFGMVVVAVGSVAGHHFLHIVETTATPVAMSPSFRHKSWIRDGLDWPDVLYLDYFSKFWYFLYLFGLTAGPAVAIGRLTMGDSPWATLMAAAAFWVFFPVCLLSSLASESRFTPFTPRLVEAYSQRPGSVLGFYVLSAPVLAVLFLTLDLVLLRTSKVSAAWAIGLSPIAVGLFFVYARLIGRLGLKLSYTIVADVGPPKAKRKKKRRKPANAYDPAYRWAMPKEEVIDDPPQRSQPSGMAGLKTADDDALTGYDVDYDGTRPPDPEPPPRMIHTFDDEDDSPIVVAPADNVPHPDRQRVAAELAKPSQREYVLHTSSRPAVEPTNPYGAGSMAFLLDYKTIAAGVVLALGVVAVAMIWRLLIELWPE